jgi:lysophospholipase L1-like esterase
MYVAVAVFVVFVLDATRFYVHLQKSKKLIEASEPFQRINDQADKKILVLGDSTAVGTGVKDPLQSTAGRLGELYPEAEIRNLAQNGLRVKDLSALIDELDAEERYSLILIQVGANDIIRFTPMEEIERSVDEILARLSQQSDKIVILHSGNVGQAPLFPIYMRPVFSGRSFQMREIYQRLSEKHGTEYVNLIASNVGESFQRYPRKYYAQDLLHLSGEGYGLWFLEILKKI